MKIFTLYYRENCHLCESMKLAMMALKKRVNFDWIEVDIDRDTDLIRLYDSKVPVLVDESGEVCHYFIDEKAILSLIEQFQS